MTRARDTRLARLAAPAAGAASAEFFERCALQAQLKVCAFVRERLTLLGIDPTRVWALRRGEATELEGANTAALAPIPGSSLEREREQFEEFAASGEDGPAGKFAAKIGDMAQRYQDGSEPDFAKASLAELFAWCLARAG